MLKNGSGYIGRSMSVNAANAYKTGEKPLFKWSKTELVDAISSISENRNIEAVIKLLTVKELQDNFLKQSSWHHTGAFFSETDFYSINEKAVSAINKELVDEIISKRTKKNKTEAERLERVKNRSALYSARDIYTKLKIIEKAGILNLKTFSGIVDRWLTGEIAEGAYQQALKVLDDRLTSAISAWEKLPQNHWRHKSIAEYKADKEAFIKSYYIYSTPISNKNVQKIKTAILKKASRHCPKRDRTP